MLTNKTYVVPRETLQPMLQSTFTNCIQPNRIASFGGLVFYPTFGYLMKIPFIALQSIFCVGMHFIAIRNGYYAVKEEVLEGRIVKDEQENQKILQMIQDRKISRFYYDLKGDIIFTAENFNLNCLKGISIKSSGDDSLRNSIATYCKNKLSKILQPQEEFLVNNRISYFHLSDEAQTQINKITKARQNRFRGAMSLFCGATLLSMYTDHLHKICRDYYLKIGVPRSVKTIRGVSVCVDYQKIKNRAPRLFTILMGVCALFLHSLSSSIYGVNERTINFGIYLKEKEWTSIVRGEKQKKYENTFRTSSKESQIYIDVFGNIVLKDPSVIVIHRKALLWDSTNQEVSLGR